MNIQHVTGRAPDSRQQATLTTFRNHFLRSGSMSVIHDDHYEITGSHPSTEAESGGNGLYFLDKKTDRWEMGWHKHPMRC
ncbi:MULTISPECIES: hypothetical protein [unclassified Pseudodesulfovibrio]|uniref:hypothetical protein n=1 Tax=unclassified Pseudodesulfovibrio TaxID=2661612 RepID=UPI000FEBBCCA|nr:MULTISPECIES: hypothetical protein [unclassified Pseudodesulfovibrio]MCJ2164936.1 hypothetical protein [Pseudodesulfovibrio sp. S3-i]